MTSGNQELSDGGYEMARAAVTLARQHACQKVAALKERMLERFPGREQDIEEGLTFWANSIRERYPNGVPRS